MTLGQAYTYTEYFIKRARDDERLGFTVNTRVIQVPA